MAAPNTILSHFSKSDLFKMAKQEGLKVDENANKKKVLEVLCLEIEDIGIKLMTAQMKKVELEQICDPLNIDHNGNSKTKVVLRKRLMEVMEKLGTETFLDKYMSVENLLTILKALKVEPDSTHSKDKLVAQTTAIVNFAGFQHFFQRFDLAFLQYLMEQRNLEVETSSKTKIAAALANHTDALAEPTQKVIEFSKKKLPIKKGITYQDIFQHYFLPEIQQWCKDNGLKTSGTKKELIHLILAHLDGDKENAAPQKKQAKKTAKEEKKKETKKADKESKDEKKTDKEAKGEKKADKEVKGEKKAQKETKSEKKADKKEEEPKAKSTKSSSNKKVESESEEEIEDSDDE